MSCPCVSFNTLTTGFYVPDYFFLFFLREIWDKRLYLSLVKRIFLFKLDQPAISEQCKWVLSIRCSVICHKSRGLHEDFEMLIRMSAVTSLRTFKNTADLSFMCAWKFWRLLLSPRLSKMSRVEYEILPCPGCILKSQGERSERRLKITTLCHIACRIRQTNQAVALKSLIFPTQAELGSKSRRVLCEILQLLYVSKSIISFI